MKARLSGLLLSLHPSAFRLHPSLQIPLEQKFRMEENGLTARETHSFRKVRTVLDEEQSPCLGAAALCADLLPALATKPRARANRARVVRRGRQRRLLRSATRPRPARDYTQRVEALLGQMTLEEKVGQMTQLQIGMVTTGNNQTIEIDPAKLEKAVVKYGVGSILNVSDQALPADKWHDIIRKIQVASQRTRLKIPVIYGIDSIHGANYVQGSTLFPQETGMAATWDPELMRRLGEVTGMETRAAGIPWTFSPVLDIG